MSLHRERLLRVGGPGRSPGAQPKASRILVLGDEQAKTFLKKRSPWASTETAGYVEGKLKWNLGKQTRESVKTNPKSKTI